MAIWDKLLSRFGKSRLYEVMFGGLSALPIYSDQNNKTYLEGYTGNNDVYSVISKIVNPLKTIPVYLVDKDGNEIEPPKPSDVHPLNLINQPNPFQVWPDFIEQFATDFLIFGNSYMGAMATENGVNAGIPQRIDILPPVWTEIVVGDFFNPIKGYKLTTSDREFDYNTELVLHLKNFNPDIKTNGSHLHGMSKLKPLFKNLAISNSGHDSMVYAFQNMGAFGILSILGEDFGEGKTKAEQINASFKQKYFNKKKTGEIVITGSDHKWTSFNLSPVDMQILEALSRSGMNIWDVYDVPTVLKAGSTDKTYSNYPEGMKILYQNNIMPFLDLLLVKISYWLLPKYGDKFAGCKLKADYDGIIWLREDMAKILTAMRNAEVFTDNEIRGAVSWEASDPSENMYADKVWKRAGSVLVDDINDAPDQNETEEILKGQKDYRK